MPYKLADKAQTKLNRAALKRSEKARNRLTILGFDELNVAKEIDSLYSFLETQSEKLFISLFSARYCEVWKNVKGKRPHEDTVDALAAMYITGLLNEPNENTHYAYEAETIRKRDRAKEAVNSVPTKTQKQIELAKAVRIWLAQAAFYMDFVSQDAEIKAFKDCGVEKVKRHERDDDRVCAVCRKEDGKVYNIDHIPPLPHLRCRRWFTPVKNG